MLDLWNILLDLFASMGPRHLSRGIPTSGYALYVGDLASMGPRHLSRGINRFPSNSTGFGTCFNGATAFEPWNR